MATANITIVLPSWATREVMEVLEKAEENGDITVPMDIRIVCSPRKEDENES